MGAQFERSAYRRVCGAATPKPPVAVAQRATGSRLSRAIRRQDPLLLSSPRWPLPPPLSVTIQKGMALEVTLLEEPVSKGESGRPCLGDPPPAPLTLYTYRG